MLDMLTIEFYLLSKPVTPEGVPRHMSLAKFSTIQLRCKGSKYFCIKQKNVKFALYI